MPKKQEKCFSNKTLAYKTPLTTFFEDEECISIYVFEL